ncbi:hypothetical protein BSG1_13536 [Bacillus sp. SG-1]|nr:hypothetical protein BSG1_13536 [Bacillus sp. SG-1]
MNSGGAMGGTYRGIGVFFMRYFRGTVFLQGGHYQEEKGHEDEFIDI